MDVVVLTGLGVSLVAGLSKEEQAWWQMSGLIWVRLGWCPGAGQP